ncbi:MAG: hypothetical protein NW226_03190 [Microscillaceae bacterium]|nr:hypothetical protein [Microscillaceae bacterium]
MKKVKILFFLTCCLAISQINQAQTSTMIPPQKNTDMNDQNCFTPENFSQVKAYILERILYSGAGKFYVEYPPDPNAQHDGIKRPSAHPENVYDIFYENTSDQIVFKNAQKTFVFRDQEGLMQVESLSKQEQVLALNIFCHLLNQSK